MATYFLEQGAFGISDTEVGGVGLVWLLTFWSGEL
jgi:hypothetical protein